MILFKLLFIRYSRYLSKFVYEELLKWIYLNWNDFNVLVVLNCFFDLDFVIKEDCMVRLKNLGGKLFCVL